METAQTKVKLRIDQKWNLSSFKTMRAYYRTLTEAKIMQKVMFYNHAYCLDSSKLHWKVKLEIIPEFKVDTSPICMAAYQRSNKLHRNRIIAGNRKCKHCLFWLATRNTVCEDDTYNAMRTAKTVKELHQAVLNRIDYLADIEQQARIKIEFDKHA